VCKGTPRVLVVLAVLALAACGRPALAPRPSPMSTVAPAPLGIYFATRDHTTGQYSPPKGEASLWPNSTAIRRISQDAPLWLHRLIPQGQLTGFPEARQSCQMTSVRKLLVLAPIKSAWRV
jgi:hypothetical protein